MFSTESIGFWLKHERVNQYRTERGSAGSHEIYAESVGKFKKITLKAFAKVSPGFALKPWVKKGTFISSQLGRSCDGFETRRTATHYCFLEHRLVEKP